MTGKKTKRKWHFGAESSYEKEILDELLYRRSVRHQSFEKIAVDLNAQRRFPRYAPKWTWATVRYFYVKNTPRKIGKVMNEDHETT